MRLSTAFGLVLTSFFASVAHSATTTFTDPVAFAAALPNQVSTLDFDSETAGTLIPSGSSLDDITFTYAIAGLSLKVTDAFDTTSGANSLGLTGGDEAMLDGDSITLDTASPVLAMGLFVITSDPALASEIELITSVGTALNSGTELSTLGDGGLIYFLGLVSTTQFSSATLDFADDGEINFAYNVDDITTAVPEPGTLPLIGIGLVVTAVGRRRLAAAERCIGAVRCL
jgi:hypothetical protein